MQETILVLDFGGQYNLLIARRVRELIDRIDVYETEGTGKNRTQRVVIHYRFVGYI